MYICRQEGTPSCHLHDMPLQLHLSLQTHTHVYCTQVKAMEVALRAMVAMDKHKYRDKVCSRLYLCDGREKWRHEEKADSKNVLEISFFPFILTLFPPVSVSLSLCLYTGLSIPQ